MFDKDAIGEYKIDKVQEAKRIIDKAIEENVVLKLVGGLAVRNHCEIIDFCERDYSDIDLVGLSKQFKEIERVFSELGYVENKDVLVASGGDRLQFLTRDGREHIDVFMDKFDMDHDVIDLKERLNIEKYTISLSDLLLTKIQIHKINEKDVRDILTILKDIPYGYEDQAGVVNFKYIAQKCSDDWGLYYDVVVNIDKCLNLMGNYTLTPQEAERIRNSLLTLKKFIEDEPKTKKWIKRSKIGVRKRWWNIIEAEDREKIRERV
ncbi:MAG: hypothetical protein QW739_03465 [Candidatus Odinarchaeota archaeon]